jgi:glycosyltransferase involved in cell wall biosynthesis
MKIALITPIKGDGLGIGMSRYANVICNGLEKEKEEIICVSFGKNKISGKFNKIINGFFPLETIKTFIKAISNKTEIYHFICPELMYKPFAIFQLFVVKKILRKKIVLSLHDLMTLEESEGKSKMNKVVHFFIQKLISYSDKIIANSEQTKEEAIKNLGVPEEKIVAIDLGLDKKFKPLPKKKLKNVVGYFGAFDVVKDPLYAVKCFAVLDKKYPGKFNFELWGKGQELEKCQSLAKKEKIQNISFKGFVPEEKIVETYNSFDVFLFTSKYEGFGLNLGEAIACGVPTIIRDEARITPELKKLCVVGENEKDIAEKIYKLHKDKKYRKQIVEKGLKEIKEFTWEKNFKGHLDVYRSLK